MVLCMCMYYSDGANSGDILTIYSEKRPLAGHHELSPIVVLLVDFPEALQQAHRPVTSQVNHHDT